ncbi:MAG: PLDc N-terminal domain-containing protein [Planctomycetota bacterium]
MLVIVPFLIIGIGSFVFWLWSLIDCVRRDFEGNNDKLIWVLVIVLAGVLGSLIYVFVGRPKGRLT